MNSLQHCSAVKFGEGCGMLSHFGPASDKPSGHPQGTALNRKWVILGHPGILNSTNFNSRLLKFRLSILQCALLSLPRCLGKYSAKVVATIETADLESLLCMGYSSPQRVSYNYTRKSLKSNQPAFKCQLDDIPVEELKICRYYIYIFI